MEPRRLAYGEVYDHEHQVALDQAMAVFMPAPHSFTTEDVVELQCHGGPQVMHAVLDLTLREGARLATPGEFTLRAFLNGRIDLAQAEAVCDLIEAKTPRAASLAARQLAGVLSKHCLLYTSTSFCTLLMVSLGGASGTKISLSASLANSISA